MTTKKILLKTSTKTSIILCADITHCYAAGSYTRIILQQGEQFVTCKSLSKAMIEIGVPFIIRISQSVAVNVHFISQVHHQKREIELISGESLRYTVKKRLLDIAIERVLNSQ